MTYVAADERLQMIRRRIEEADLRRAIREYTSASLADTIERELDALLSASFGAATLTEKRRLLAFTCRPLEHLLCGLEALLRAIPTREAERAAINLGIIREHITEIVDALRWDLKPVPDDSDDQLFGGDVA